MSMSTRVEAFKPPNEKWRRMKAVYDACVAAKIEVPGEVDGFFGGEAPDDNGVEITESELRISGALSDWKGEYAQGVEVDTAKLPKDVTVIRFYNSW